MHISAKVLYTFEMCNYNYMFISEAIGREGVLAYCTASLYTEYLKLL